MSNRETSREIASMAGRILASGNPLDNEQVVLALVEAIAEANSGAGVKAALTTMFGPYFANALSLAGSCLSQAEPDDAEDGSPVIWMSTQVGWDKIVNAVIGAFEGGSGYWLTDFDYARKPGGVAGNPLYAETDFWAKGGSLEVTYDNPVEGEDSLSKVIGINEIRAGLRSMAIGDPRHFGDLLSENDDAITHDVFMQHVVLGEVVYG